MHVFAQLHNMATFCWPVPIITPFSESTQGLMFGYATDETEECMPLTVVLAHRLNERIAELRRSGEFWWARPDSKTQVTAEYVFESGACIPQRVHTIVVSLQHSDKIGLEELRKNIMDKVIKDVIPAKYFDSNTIVHINPCGLFIIGGPQVCLKCEMFRISLNTTDCNIFRVTLA